MQISNLPVTKLPIPFAASAGGGYIRTIPQASQIGIVNGAASLTDGFPPLNFVPVGSGGVPPYGQDMNGILFEISSWTAWQNAGGLVPYDSVFSSAIGGYPANAILAGTAAGAIYLNLADNNTTNPNSGGATWAQVATATAVLNSKYASAVDTGASGSLVVALTPAATSYIKFMTFQVQTTHDAVGADVINVNGLGSVAIADKSGAAATALLWQSGDFIDLVYDGSKFRVIGGNNQISPSLSTVSTATTSVSNAVATKIPLTSGSSSFGAIASNQLTFTRRGTYLISMTVPTAETFTGPTNVYATLSMRKNGTEITGGYNEDSNYGTTSTTFTVAATLMTSFNVGDIFTAFATVAASSSFISGSITGASINIVQIS